MTEDLEAIDVLSEQFKEAVDQVRPYGDGDSIVIPTSIESQGQKVLRMYEAEARNAPDDVDVKAASAFHMYRMAWMYYRAYNPILLNMDSGNSWREQVGFLQNVCHFAYQSFQVFPNSAAAFIMADIFRMNKFYATALHWYKQAEQSASEGSNTDMAINAKAKRLDLQSDGRTADPQITRKTRWPTYETPGLISVPPVQAANSVPAPSAQMSSGNAGFQSAPQAKAPNWGIIKTGGIVFVVGLLLNLLHVALGGLAILVSIGMIIFGFVKGK